MNHDVIIEDHPAWHYEFPGMKVLILGNFPPHRKRWNYEFYYPNRQNNFWKVLALLAGTPLKEMEGPAAVEERKRLMKKLRTGVENIAGKIKRKGHSARDTDIEILEYRDVFSLIRRQKKLERIILAGYSAPNSTARKFIEYLEHHNIPFEKPASIKQGTEFFITVGKRRIPCVILNSTSTAFPIKLEKLAEQFRPYIK